MKRNSWNSSCNFRHCDPAFKSTNEDDSEPKRQKEHREATNILLRLAWKVQLWTSDSRPSLRYGDQWWWVLNLSCGRNKIETGSWKVFLSHRIRKIGVFRLLISSTKRKRDLNENETDWANGLKLRVEKHEKSFKMTGLH